MKRGDRLVFLRAFSFGILPALAFRLAPAGVRQRQGQFVAFLEMAPTSVYAVRHGESVWNVVRKKHPSDEDRYSSALYHPDCDITDRGVQQSKDAGTNMTHLLSSSANNGEDMAMIVSPLRRALQTADGMVEGGLLPRPKTVVVQPLAAEIVVDSCDIGSPTSGLQQEFPAYNFSHMQENWWWPYGRTPEETYQRLSQHGEQEPESHALERIGNLKSFLNDIEVPVVILVCHSETIWWLSSRVKNGERVGTWTENGEIVDVTSFVREQ